MFDFHRAFQKHAVRNLDRDSSIMRSPLKKVAAMLPVKKKSDFPDDFD
jgi:hypothetical protein